MKRIVWYMMAALSCAVFAGISLWFFGQDASKGLYWSAGFDWFVMILNTAAMTYFALQAGEIAGDRKFRRRIDKEFWEQKNRNNRLT